MNICVAGWYFHDRCYRALMEVKDKYNVVVISHNTDKIPIRWLQFHCFGAPNVGLEFGAYDFFIKMVWPKFKEDTLFMHDDVSIDNISVFDSISKLDLDQAYIFRSKQEEVNNGGKHGRAIYMSTKLITFLLQWNRTNRHSASMEDPHNPGNLLPALGEYNGIWYDPNNYGHNSGKPPVGVRHYNEAIWNFHREMGRIRDNKAGNEPMNVVNRIFYPEFRCAKRGIER